MTADEIRLARERADQLRSELPLPFEPDQDTLAWLAERGYGIAMPLELDGT